MSVKKLLGLRIKELRNKAKYTQEELAEKVGIDPKHQSCVENGRNFPSADLIERYASTFEIDVQEVLNLKRYEKDKNEYIKEITKMIKSADDNEIALIYKIVFDILK